MHRLVKYILYWLPRMLGILVVAFLVLLSLDVFGMGSPLQTLVALLIHLVPAFLTLIVLVLAWRWEWVGAFGFTLLAIWIIYLSVESGPGLSASFVVGGLPLLVGILFLVGWLLRRQIHPLRHV